MAAVLARGGGGGGARGRLGNWNGGGRGVGFSGRERERVFGRERLRANAIWGWKKEKWQFAIDRGVQVTEKGNEIHFIFPEEKDEQKGKKTEIIEAPVREHNKDAYVGEATGEIVPKRGKETSNEEAASREEEEVEEEEEEDGNECKSEEEMFFSFDAESQGFALSSSSQSTSGPSGVEHTRYDDADSYDHGGSEAEVELEAEIELSTLARNIEVSGTVGLGDVAAAARNREAEDDTLGFEENKKNNKEEMDTPVRRNPFKSNQSLRWSNVVFVLGTLMSILCITQGMMKAASPSTQCAGKVSVSSKVVGKEKKKKVVKKKNV